MALYDQGKIISLTFASTFFVKCLQDVSPNMFSHVLLSMYILLSCLQFNKISKSLVRKLCIPMN